MIYKQKKAPAEASAHKQIASKRLLPSVTRVNKKGAYYAGH
jgi:hypothetical protein